MNTVPEHDYYYAIPKDDVFCAFSGGMSFSNHHPVETRNPKHLDNYVVLKDETFIL